MPIYSVRHVTTCRYLQPVASGEHRMMLAPCEGHDQRPARVEISTIRRNASFASFP